MIPSNWIPHRRVGDRELVGYLVLDGDHFTPVTHFGYPLGEPSELDVAETILDEQGLAVLAERWTLDVDGDEVPVRVLEVTDDHVLVAEDHFGGASVVGAEHVTHRLPVPTDALRR